MLRLHSSDADVAVWWATPVECASAIARREHTKSLTPRDAKSAFDRLDDLAALWREIPPSARVRELGLRLLRTHALRSADALQLAAALVAAEEQPATLDFVCLDDRLTLAALREGFTVVP
jgi:predicted nucleic acid-binding protein